LKDCKSKLSISIIYHKKDKDMKILKNSNLSNSNIKRKFQKSI